MARSNAYWPTQQLVEFLDVVSAASDADDAVQRAVERAAEALDAEVAAILRSGALIASVGYPRGEVDEQSLIAAAAGAAVLELGGLGPATVETAPISSGDPQSALLVARVGEEPFATEDIHLLRGMASVLNLALRTLRALDQERALHEHSQRETAERERAEQKYRNLVERVPAIVYRADTGEYGRFHYVSPKIESILGFSQEEWLADPGLWSRQLHPDDREQVLAVETDPAAAPDSPLDYRMVAKDGRVVWFLDEAVLETNDGEAPYWHGVLYDITDRKRAEEMKGEFFALVSHELRTPLTSIVGYLDLLLEDRDALPTTALSSVEVIERNARRLERLVGDLLFTAQLESGNFELDRRATRLDQIALECVEGAMPRANGRQIDLRLEAEPLAPADADPSRLAQAIDNLLSNSMKFTPPGGEVVVAVGRDNGSLTIEVRDTGIGIPEADQRHLFDRFHRSSNALDGSAEGAGLGMAIVKAIVDAHGGQIRIESVEGAGTTVQIAVPGDVWSEGRQNGVWVARGF